jgi:hypothetical protein
MESGGREEEGDGFRAKARKGKSFVAEVLEWSRDLAAEIFQCAKAAQQGHEMQLYLRDTGSG